MTDAGEKSGAGDGVGARDPLELEDADDLAGVMTGAADRVIIRFS